MAEVRRLPPSVVQQIAAGEMIERPISVLKELLENAIDAGASRIHVTIEGTLDQRLSVSDDGSGMTADALRLAVERHATSKLSCAEDLLRLSTLGFRGEALPAIGSVSRMTITTAVADGEPGAAIEVVAGEVLDVRPATRRKGTTVDVQDLFFNVPARRKFLKTDRGELRAGLRLFSQLALAVPAVEFVWERDEGPTVHYPPADSPRARIAQVFGRARTEGLLDVAYEAGDIGVYGAVSRPEESRATRNDQSLYVNGRPVSSPLLSHAAKMGFRDLIPGDRFPWFVLDVSVPPDSIDVNVHPTKREVKFARENEVFSAVRRAVMDALATLAPEALSADRVRERPGTPFPAPPTNQLTLPAKPERVGEDAPLVPERAPREVAPGVRVARSDEPKFWQLHRRYVFAQTASGVLVVDQHAAHERILYERAIARLGGEPAATQQLLFPEPIELTALEWELFTEIEPNLTKLGFETESFGGNTVLVRAIPADVHGWDKGQLLRDLLDEYVNVGRSVRAVRERIARAFACRGAIKSGTALAPEEMRALIDRLFATETPHGDPHGRATLIQFSLAELDRRFGRS